MSIQADGTTDVSCRAKFSIILRYVYTNKIIERFMGFYNVSSDKRAEDLSAKFLRVINTCNLFHNLMVMQVEYRVYRQF